MFYCRQSLEKHELSQASLNLHTELPCAEEIPAVVPINGNKIVIEQIRAELHYGKISKDAELLT